MRLVTLPLQRVLSQRSMHIVELVRELGVSRFLVEIALRASARAYNVGTAEYPVWCWRIGPRASDASLRRTVSRLLSERPMSLQHLAAATGVEVTRVASFVLELDRKKRLTRFGEMWFLARGDDESISRG